jgi:hypothetical protein
MLTNSAAFRQAVSSKTQAVSNRRISTFRAMGIIRRLHKIRKRCAFDKSEKADRNNSRDRGGIVTIFHGIGRFKNSFDLDNG